MLSFTLRFPLGVYHALAPRPDRHNGAEWPPHPVRLIGALLAAAHEVPSDDVEADRAVLQQICEASPPTVFAPRAALASEQASRDGQTVAELRGPSRWAPRNPSVAEAKDLSPLMVRRTPTEIAKSGVAIGDRPVTIAWPELDFAGDRLERVRRMAANVAWLGTSRSPVLVTVETALEEAAASTPRWTPLPWSSPTPPDASLRVPDPSVLGRFDAAFAARRSEKDRIESAGNQQPAFAGAGHPYSLDDGRGSSAVFDPQHWGRFTIVAIDADSASAGLPRAPSAYVLARTFRNALMATFEERGEANDAPEILHGRGDRPHIAVVPLPTVGHRHAKGSILGFGLLFPSEERCPEVAAQVDAIDGALAEFFPGAGDARRELWRTREDSLAIEPSAATEERRWTLNTRRYRGPATTWVTATPVVLSRWTKGRDRAVAIQRQVALDCSYVGLPEPAEIEVLRTAGAEGGASRLLPQPSKLPPEWRKSLTGPTVHLRLRFDARVRGPLLLGRARHFGVGLLVPESSPPS